MNLYNILLEESKKIKKFSDTNEEDFFKRNKKNTFIKYLKIVNFRNYNIKELNFKSKITVLYGDNGVGKTNILEAITLLDKGRGLRHCELNEIINKNSNKDYYTISAKVSDESIGNINSSYKKDGTKKVFYLDSKKILKTKELFTFIWITPQMNNIFISVKSNRRKLLDRIVGDFNNNYHKQVTLYDKLIKERSILLNKHFNSGNIWIDLVEKKISDLILDITLARIETINLLNRIISKNNLSIKLICEPAKILDNLKSLNPAFNFIDKIKNNRDKDRITGKTNFGIHKTDFTIIRNDIEAKYSSTGEQKMMLIYLTFAHIEMILEFGNKSLILLFDDIVSYLDKNRRKDFFYEINKFNVQCLLTGVSDSLFSELKETESADFIHLTLD